MTGILQLQRQGRSVIKLAFDISNIESSGDKFFANARFRVASGSSGFNGLAHILKQSKWYNKLGRGRLYNNIRQCVAVWHV